MEFKDVIKFKLPDLPRINIQEIESKILNWLLNPDLITLNNSIREISNYNFWLSDFIFDVSLPKFIKIGNKKRYVNYLINFF